jgi:flagellar motor switch protein FliM
MNSEVNPQFANIVSPMEIVVVSTIHISLEGGGGDLQLTMPYSMIEPIRELLNAGIQSDRGTADDRWKNCLRNDLMDVELDLQSTLVEKILHIDEVLDLSVGDVIPVEIPDQVLITVESIPLYRAKVGVSEGKYALQIQSRVQRRRPEGEQPTL